MKPVRGLRGTGLPPQLDTTRDLQDSAAPNAVNAQTEAAVAQVQRVRRRDEQFDSLDEPADDIQGPDPVIFGRTAALAATQTVTLADRSLEAFRSADIGALIDRLAAIDPARKHVTAPAADVLQRLQRLMEFTERRRSVARPVAGPPPARDGLKRSPSPPRPDFAPHAEPAGTTAPAKPTPSAGLAAARGSRPEKDRPQ
jgi:hypothetical protein